MRKQENHIKTLCYFHDCCFSSQIRRMISGKNWENSRMSLGSNSWCGGDFHPSSVKIQNHSSLCASRGSTQFGVTFLSDHTSSESHDSVWLWVVSFAHLMRQLLRTVTPTWKILQLLCRPEVLDMEGRHSIISVWLWGGLTYHGTNQSGGYHLNIREH